jgi:hypothetical protein
MVSPQPGTAAAKGRIMAPGKPWLLRTWIALWAGIGLAGCAHHYVLNSPADARTLPVRRGWEGINVVAVTPWRYMGSRYQTHEFRYYFDRDDALKYRDVSVARDRTVLNFEEKPVGYVKGKVWVTLAADGQTFYFSLLPMH